MEQYPDLTRRTALKKAASMVGGAIAVPAVLAAESEPTEAGGELCSERDARRQEVRGLRQALPQRHDRRGD